MDGFKVTTNRLAHGMRWLWRMTVLVITPRSGEYSRLMLINIRII